MGDPHTEVVNYLPAGFGEAALPVGVFLAGLCGVLVLTALAGREDPASN